MKKALIILLTSCLFFGVHGYSQRLYLGLKGGLNYSIPRGDYTSGKWEYKQGTDVGFIAGWKLTNHLSLQSGLDYTTLNYRMLSYRNNYGPYYDIIAMRDDSKRWNLKYFRVPLVARLTVGNRFQFTLEGGGYWGVCNRSSGEYSYPILYADNSLDYIYTGDFKARSVDWGILAGTGLQYRVSPRISVLFDATWSSGSKQIWNDDWQAYNSRNGAVHLAVGITYSLGKIRKSPSSSDSTSGFLTLGRLRFIPHGGILISNHTGDDLNGSYHSKTGMVAGMIMEYPFARRLTLQTAINFERKGYAFHGASNTYFRYTSTTDFPRVNTDVNLDYIEIPLLISFHLGNTIRFSVRTGPYVSFLMNATCQGTAYTEGYYSYGYSEYLKHINDNVQGAFKKADIGWIVGCGTEIPVKRRLSVLVDADFSQGFTDIFSDKLNYYSVAERDRTGHNQAAVFSVGFSYHL